MAQRVVLAYSGGLDTSVAVRWMTETWGVEVIALAVDVGQTSGTEGLVERARAAGAVEALVVDATREFAEEFCFPALRANALYEGRYPLVSALSRPLIVRHLVAAAEAHGADAIAHGCTGKGNDQVRFEVSARALAPHLEVLAPVREWGMTRADCVAYARRHDIPVRATTDKPYSIDDNLWGRAVECGELEDPWAPPPDDIWEMTVLTDPGPTDIVIGFEEGRPTTVDGRALDPATLIVELNRRVGAHGWGRLDMVENRRVGIKSRECYEAPGALALIAAHRELESITLERELAHHKQQHVEGRWADLVYDGMWFSPLKEALDRFVDASQRHVTGEVRLRCEAGSVLPTGRRSPASLYDYGLATYEDADTFRHSDAEGFVRLWGLGIQTWAARQGGAS